MFDKLYLSKLSNLVAENRLLKFVIIIIGLATLFNSVAVHRAVNAQKVVVVPAGLSVETLIESNNLPDDYIETMTRYIMGLAVNYTPSSARVQFDRLLRLYAPEQFPSAKKLFYDLAAAVETSKNTTAYYISKIVTDKRKSQIEVTGVRKQFADTLKISESMKVYYLDFVVVNGRFMLTKFTEKPD